MSVSFGPAASSQGNALTASTDQCSLYPYLNPASDSIGEEEAKFILFVPVPARQHCVPLRTSSSFLGSLPSNITCLSSIIESFCS